MRTVGQTAQLQFFNDGKQRVAGPSDSLAAAVKQAQTAPLIPLPAGAKAELDKLAKGEPSTKYLAVVAQPGKYGNNTTPLYFIYTLPPAMTGSAISKSSADRSTSSNRPTC